MSEEQQFESELEIFRKESETASQFFFGYLAINEVAKHNRGVLTFLNKNALLWSTVAGALQMSALIALHRIFNHRSRHNVDALLRLVESNTSIFSKQALRRRKQGNVQKEPGWLTGYIRDAYEPTARDFQRLRALVEKYSKLYQSNYAGLRNKVYAHMVASDPSEVQTLVARTNIHEMQRMFVFLLKLYEALQELYTNGRKPVLRARRYSAVRMRNSSSRGSGSDVHVQIAKEFEHVLLEAAAQDHDVADKRRTKVLLRER